MVKAVVPPEVDDSLGWLMREGGGLGWDGLVDYGVHLAISALTPLLCRRSHTRTTA